MIDTHCHLTYAGLHERVDAVVEAARVHGVDRMISVGTTPADGRRALALTQRFPGVVYATVGVHPGHSAEVDDVPVLQAELREMLQLPGAGIVALGEMGLDRHYPEPPLDVQRDVFAAQLALMKPDPATGFHYQGPAVIHNRKATDETLAMIAESGIAGDRFVFHCFTGPAEDVVKILAIGAKVSFTGIVTFGSAADLAEASDLVPLDRLMIETDSPYLTPAPYRKVKTNEPRYVREVAAFLAARRGMSLEDFVRVVDQNAERFFGLPPKDTTS